MTITELYTYSKALRPYQIRDEVLKELEPTIIDAITEDQLQLGIDGNGNQFPEYADKDYAKEKSTMNSRSKGRYDLKYTGSFYSGMKMEMLPEMLVVNSTDEKNEEIKSWGFNIFGLTPENFEKISKEYAIPEFMKRVKSVLHL